MVSSKELSFGELNKVKKAIQTKGTHKGEF